MGDCKNYIDDRWFIAVCFFKKVKNKFLFGDFGWWIELVLSLTVMGSEIFLI